MSNMTKMDAIAQQVDQWINDDKKEITKFLSALVQCQTPSPPGDTRKAMALVEGFLSSRSLPFEKVTADETMPNLISTMTMPLEGRHLMLSGHLDVLPAGSEPGWLHDPWSGHISDGCVWGRGTADMKAGVTVMLFAYLYLTRLRKSLSGRLSIVLASDEETGMGRGTGYMFSQIPDQMEADCVLSPEPSGTEAITFSSKGYLHFLVTVETRGSIAGYPNYSANAIRIATDIIRDLDELEQITADIPSAISSRLNDGDYRAWYDNMYGEGSAEVIPVISTNIGTITGGDSPAVIASNFEFEVTVVMPTGLNPHVIFEKASDIVSRYPEARIELMRADLGDISNPDNEMVAILQDTVIDLGWPKPQLVPDVAISDLRYWRHRGIPGFWYGPNGENVSAANESVNIEKMLHLLRTYVFTSARYLQATVPLNDDIS
ncbi:uncharacterized protein QYS62_008245 [Fusarium acuminatum]|uniref:Peptidase M20 dimerisation domain-containing protein n=1 Tax=Fusarium acuminatum TaxID=5515 RepID=A0ABZ2X216_9HYPO